VIEHVKATRNRDRPFPMGGGTAAAAPGGLTAPSPLRRGSVAPRVVTARACATMRSTGGFDPAGFDPAGFDTSQPADGEPSVHRNRDRPFDFAA
jgi:hypothetical protein